MITPAVTAPKSIEQQGELSSIDARPPSPTEIASL